MKVTKFIKPDILVNYYDQEIREALLFNDIHDIEFFGYLDAEGTIDPDYLGYAEWNTNPLIKFDILNAMGGKKFPVENTDIDIEMMVLGRDFYEAMRGAFLMLGQALFFANHQAEDVSTTYGSVNLNGAINQLNIASDRIRDYYVYAVTGSSFNSYKQNDSYKTNKNKGQFSQFFDYSVSNLNSIAVDLATKTAAIASDLEAYRKERNSMVHDLSSYYAKIQKVFLESQQQDQSLTEYASVKDFIEDLPINIEWYKKLIDIGNLVFLIESKIREARQDET